MADFQHDIDVPHRVNIDGEMLEIAEFQVRLNVSCEPEGWAIESAEVDCIGEDNKRRWQIIPKQSALWASAMVAVSHPTHSEALDEKYEDFITDGGTKATGRAA